MVSGFNFNEKELQRLMQPQMNQIAAEYTKEFARLKRAYTGRPVSEIKPKIRALVAKFDGDFSSKEIDQYAQLVHDGVDIKFQLK